MLFAQAQEEKWVDSVMEVMTEKQKLGQLFMIAAYSNKDEKHYAQIDTLVSKYQVGGLIFFQGGPKRQALLTNRYQNLSKVPLLIGIDGEWGLAMRLDSTLNYPKQMTLGAIAEDSTLYLMGKQIAKECKRLGIHINFAPVIDVNNNPANPVIGMRSFGETKEWVSAKGLAYMKGMQQGGIMACGKHFPGHGDTDSDSHFGLPIINHSKDRMSQLELFPFRKLIEDSLQSIMVAHIHVPAYDSRPNRATTLSPYVVQNLLKKQLNFKGLVFTDALNMKGVAKYYAPGEVDVEALIAGNDVLLFAEDVPVALEKIEAAFASGRLKKSEIFSRVRKILISKYKLGLHKTPFIDTSFLYQDLMSLEGKALRHELYKKSITCLKNEGDLLPIKNVDLKPIISLTIGSKVQAETHRFSDYAPTQYFHLNKNFGEKEEKNLFDSIKKSSIIIVGLHQLNNKRKERYGIQNETIVLIQKLEQKHQVIVVVYGNPYAVQYLSSVPRLICTYEDNDATRDLIPQAIMGAFPMEGRLSVAIPEAFKKGTGIQISSLKRLQYNLPESKGLLSSAFNPIDSIMDATIKVGASPGAQVLIAYKGSVVFRKNYGYLSYDKQNKVQNETMYDLASVTKVAATMQAMMFLYDHQSFQLGQTLGELLPELQNSNKANLLISDVLTHQAGLPSYLELWRKTISRGKPNSIYYQYPKNQQFNLQVAPNLYTCSGLQDSVFNWIRNSKLSDEKADTGCYAYKYSDLGFYLLKRYADKALNQDMSDFLSQNFYHPLGTSRLLYTPLNFFSNTEIAPTEEDKSFRGERIIGTVHDQGAAMCGGKGGHAGLFGTANDLAILGQMHLQKGYYGGKRYLKSSTIDLFTKVYRTNNRRALGWDRPFPPEEISKASPSSYGHTGFTGTAWWMDPEKELVIVILSNRTYPFAENKKFTTYSVRTKITNAVYDALERSNYPSLKK